MINLTLKIKSIDCITLQVLIFSMKFFKKINYENQT